MICSRAFFLTLSVSRWEREQPLDTVVECRGRWAEFCRRFTKTIARRFLVLLWPLALLVGGFNVFGADGATPGFRGDGLCRFALQQYVLPKVNEDRINLIVADLLRRHAEAFNFTANPDLRVRIRIFGTFESYRKFATTNRISYDHETLSISNLAGYYSPRDNEVVTWRQRDPAYLANNILHECSHAIMHQQFQVLPTWLDEGCAVYFSFPVYMRDAQDDLALRSRWYELRKWLQDGSLPELRKFLNNDPQEFRRQDPQLTYAVSWSLFQLLMSTPENRRAMNEMIAEYQKPAAKAPDCARLLDKFYPGGVARMDKDWRGWIARGAANVLGTQ